MPIDGDRLSDDNILGILSRLPFPSLVRASAVCKRWRRLALVTKSKQPTSWCLLSCPARSPFDKSSSRRSWRVSSSNGRSSRNNSSNSFHIVMFDPFTRKWLKVANPFAESTNPFTSSSRELLVVPSTGGYSGLVCVVEWGEESSNSNNLYFVGNPINNKWKTIHGPSPWRGVHQLVVDPITKAYKIITIRWERSPKQTAQPYNSSKGVWRVAIYDSEEGKWRKGKYFSDKSPPSGTPYTLSSRTHTASDKMMYLMMHRAGKLINWETYTEIQILGYDIENDNFEEITPVARFDRCVEYFEPTSCRDWPLHIVLKSDNFRSQDEDSNPSLDQLSDPSCLQLVTSAASIIEPKWSFWGRKAYRGLINKLKGRPYAHQGFVNKMCIFEFDKATKTWEVKEENSSLQVFGKFYSKERTFHCAGDRMGHLYCAHLDDFQSVVVYNPKRDDFSTWSRLPPLDPEYGGFVAKNYHSLGSFIPRLDVQP